MKIFAKVVDIQRHIEILKSEKKQIGFIPTMGALHEGHLSLIRRAQTEVDITVVSIFVNPTQFNDKSDFDKYPVMIDEDKEKLMTVKCDILFLPSVAEMYENNLLTVTPIDIGFLDTILEGAKRPGHYTGVVTIVEKLFRVISPDRVYMGLKDFQQVKVIEKLIRDRAFPIQMVGCPTLRERNGLAMSSRNMRLTDLGREQASEIYQALVYVKKYQGKDSPKKTIANAIHHDIKIAEVEYFELRNAADLSEVNLEKWDKTIRYVALFAGKIEGVRLIDNLEF